MTNKLKEQREAETCRCKDCDSYDECLSGHDELVKWAEDCLCEDCENYDECWA